MRFYQASPVKIILLGAGGTGGYIAPHLYRIACTLNRDIRIIVVDGDVVEEKNLIRQNFAACDIGENKAKVLAERYSGTFGITTEYHPEFIENVGLLEALTETECGYYSRLPELVILIGAVDNNRSRQMCHKVFCEAKNLVYIDSGNGEYTGQVVCGVRRNGKTLAKPIGGLYPDILKSEDSFPTELSCADHNLSAPQSIAANLLASTSVVTLLYHILVLGQLDVRSMTFSGRTLNVKSILRKGA